VLKCGEKWRGEKAMLLIARYLRKNASLEKVDSK